MGEVHLDGHRHHGLCGTESDAHAEREGDDAGCAGRSRPGQPEDGDPGQAGSDSESGTDPAGEQGAGRREQPHAENRDRAQQPCHRMRDVEIVLDPRDQRADANQLGAQRQRCEEEARKQRHAPSAHGARAYM